jgi:glycosyltransferase involved in cell wall biosynthesis
MISVCVLSYNRLEFLQQSLESMVETAGEPLEIIVHDDGSNVSVVRWLVESVTSGGISHLILNPIGHNEGQGTALNRMFHMASGDIIIKADQDLIYKPGWARAIREILEASQDAREQTGQFDAVGCLGLFKYEVDPVDHRKMHTAMKMWGRVQWDVVKDFVGSLMVVPRKTWEELGPFDEHSDAFAEDYSFKMKVAQSPGWCLGLTPTDLVTNVGFGEGPSTVVVRNEKNELTSRAIHHGPHLVTGKE